MALPWVVGLEFQSLGHSELQQIKLYVIYSVAGLLSVTYDLGFVI